MKTKICQLCPKGLMTIKQSDGQFKLFMEQIDDENPEHVVLNMADVTFVDSTGVSLIIKISRKCKKNQIGFSITNCNERILDLFNTLRLNLVFPVN